MRFVDVTDYDGDKRKWEVRESGEVIASDLSKREAIKLAGAPEGGYRRSAHVQTGGGGVDADRAAR